MAKPGLEEGFIGIRSIHLTVETEWPHVFFFFFFLSPITIKTLYFQNNYFHSNVGLIEKADKNTRNCFLRIMESQRISPRWPPIEGTGLRMCKWLGTGWRAGKFSLSTMLCTGTGSPVCTSMFLLINGSCCSPRSSQITASSFLSNLFSFCIPIPTNQITIYLVCQVRLFLRLTPHPFMQTQYKEVPSYLYKRAKCT